MSFLGNRPFAVALDPKSPQEYAANACILQGCFFSFSHYIHYALIKREKSFFSFMSLLSIHRGQERKFFFFFFFAFSHYVHYAMVKRESLFSLCHSLRSLRHDQEKEKVFSFSHYIQYAMVKRGKKVSFHLVTTFTTS